MNSSTWYEDDSKIDDESQNSLTKQLDRTAREAVPNDWPDEMSVDREVEAHSQGQFEGRVLVSHLQEERIESRKGD